MKTILVPTDGSTAAEKALDVALDLAEKHDAGIKLMHVLLRDKEPFELLRLPDIEADKGLTEEIRKLASGPRTPRSAAELMANPNLPERPAPESLLRTIGASVLARACARATARGVRVEVLDVADGGTAPAISTAATEHGADTIVMGMRGLRYSDALTYGSVSQEVCRSVGCACIAVH